MSLIHEDKFKKLQEFLHYLFKDDEVTKRECVRSILFKDKIIDSIFKNYSPKELEHILKLYNEYHDSEEELQLVFMLDGSGDLTESLFNAKDKLFETFLNQIKEEFASKMDILREDIEIYCQKFYNYSESIQNIKIFEQFLMKNFDENLAKKFVRSILLIKKDFGPKPSLIYGSVRDDKAEELKIIISLLKSYSNSPKEIQNYLKSLNVFLSWFFDYLKDEIYQILKEFLIEVFASDKRELMEFLKFQEIIYVSENEEKLKIFESFLMDFFENDVNLIRKQIRKVLFHKNDEDALISTGNLFSFKNLISFLFKYKNSNEEIQKLFITGKLMLLDMTSSIKIQHLLIDFLNEVFMDNKMLIKDCMHGRFSHVIISDETKFVDFLEFLSKLFENNEKLIKDCFRNILLGEFRDDDHPLFNAATSTNSNDYIRVSELYLKYTNSFEDLQEMFIKSKILIPIFLKITSENFQNFQDFIKRVFESDKRKLVDCMCCSEGYEIILNKENFESFCKFLSNLLQDELKRESIRRILFNDYSIYAHPLIKSTHCYVRFPTQCFEDIKNLYLKYSNSVEELQNIFNKNNLLLQIIMNLDDKIYSSFVQFFTEIFKNNMDNLSEFVTVDVNIQHFNGNNEFKNIEKFLKHANCNENQIKNCIIKFLSNEYLPQNHPIVFAIRNELDELKKVFTFYTKVEGLRKIIKNVFMTQKIILAIFKEIKMENYEAFLKFIEEIFKSENFIFRENFILNYNKYDFKDLGNKRREMLKNFLLDFVFKEDENKVENVKKHFLLIHIPKLFICKTFKL